MRLDAPSADGMAGGLARVLRSELRGQSTVEYAVVLAGFLAMLLALGLAWGAGRDGTLARRAEGAASHAVGEDAVDGLRDVALF